MTIHKTIRLVAAVAGLLASATAISAADVSLRKEVFHNDRVAAYLVEIPPQQSTGMEREDKDSLSVVVSGEQITGTVEGRAPKAESVAIGAARFRRTGFAQSLRNDDVKTFRTVIVEFAQPQGYPISEELPAKHQCNEGSRTECVELKHLFCTTAICAEDVRMAPGAMRTGFASDSDQMLIAVTDYALSDGVGGGPPATHSRPSGQVEWIPAGSANRWTNTSSVPAHFILIRFNADH
jgi:hypothetical protein